MIAWNDAVEQFARVTDKLGKKIDENIFETVIALNVLGITTAQSCEGHLEWGLPYPWISIQADIEQKYQLNHYLSAFYATRVSICFDTVLVFHGYRIRSHGAAFTDLFTDEERKQKLEAYQAEMREFTHFLKSLLFR